MSQYRMPISETMKKNIDSIINTDYELGVIYQQSGIKIVDRPSSALLDFECKFHGRSSITGEDYEFEPYSVTKLVIEQQFNDSFMDNITLMVSLTPLQLVNILDNYRDLNCTIILKQRYPKFDFVFHDKVVFDETFKVVVKDKEIKKRLSKKALLPENKMDQNIEHSSQMFDRVEFQLIKEESYLLRKKKFNFMMRDVTVKDVILYMAKQCGIKQVCLTEPDNKQVYTNMIVPPQKTFVTCMEFLQNYYGIYNKGLSYYFTDNTLYIYPAYETNPTTKDSAHLYYAGEDAVTGVELYHAYSEDNMIHIVIASTPIIKDLVDGGIENFGNATLFQHSDRIVDLYSSIGEGVGNYPARMGMGRLDIKEPNTSIFSPKDTDFGLSKDTYNIVFKHTNNLCKEKSDMYSYMRSLVAFKWQNAWPDSFKPGYLIHYHYDGEDIERRLDGDELDYADSAEYMTRDGICQSVTYTIQPAQGEKLSKRQTYSCIADVILSVEYEPANPEKKASIDTSMLTSGESAFTSVANIVNSQSSDTGVSARRYLGKTGSGLFDL